MKKTRQSPPLDFESDIRRKVEAEFSEVEKGIAEYLREGKNSITKIDKDLRQRLILLLLLAAGEEDFHQLMETIIPNAKWQIVDALCSAARFSNFCVVELANELNAQAAECVWDAGVELVSAIGALAKAHPALLRPRARRALYMPSFRANAKKFTDDFQIKSEKIELSKDFPAKTGDKAMYGLDSSATQFVVELLKEANEKRQLLITVASFLDETRGSKTGLGSLDREKVLLSLPGIHPEHLGYLDLPPYSKATAKLWWEKCIKPQLDNPETLRGLEGSEFYKSLVKGAKLPAEYQIRDYLKKLCMRPVLNSLAP